MNISNRAGSYFFPNTQRSSSRFQANNNNSNNHSQSWGNLSSNNNIGALLALISQLISQLKQKPQQAAPKEAKQPVSNRNNDNNRQPDSDQEDNLANENRCAKKSGYQRGTRGNDYLSDSSGDDHLRGGKGNDTLVTSAGNDSLRGGRGRDLAILKGGNIDDYEVSQASRSTLKLSHNGSGHTVLINRDIERIQFNDTTVSWTELRQQAGTKPRPPKPEPQPVLDLDPQMRDAIQQHFSIFGEQNFSVIDKDSSKSLSLGDVVSVSGGISGGTIREITLTQDDLNAINGAGPIDNDALQQLNENRALWESKRPDDYSYVLSRSGFISPDAREPVKLTVNGDNVNDAELISGADAIVPEFNQLTVDDLFNTIEQAINSGAERVEVSYDPELGYPTDIFIDQSSLIADEEVYLSASNLQEIGSSSHELSLSLGQQDALSYYFNDTSALAYDGLATEFSGIVRDANGDNELSMGDIVVLRKYGGNAVPQADFMEDYALTTKDLDSINNFANQPRVALSDEQRQRLEQAVLRQDVAYIPGDGPRLHSVTDKDGDAKLSVGDAIKIITTSGFETGNPSFTTRFESLTQEQLDRYEAGIPYNPSQADVTLSDS